MNSFSLADCTTVEAALSQLKNGAVVKAGGVDLLDRISQARSLRVTTRDGVIDVGRGSDRRPCHDLRGGRLDDVEGLLVLPAAPFAADQQPRRTLDRDHQK